MMRQINNYPRYFLTEDGDVYSTWVHAKNPTGKPKKLKPYLNSDGYMVIRLVNEKSRKMYSIHRLVAMTYLPTNTDKSLQVDHIDNKKTNNHFLNLRWVTQKENLLKKYNEDGHKIHFAKPVRQFHLDGSILNEWPSALDAAKATNSDNSAISKVCRGVLNTTNNYKWEYV